MRRTPRFVFGRRKEDASGGALQDSLRTSDDGMVVRDVREIGFQRGAGNQNPAVRGGTCKEGKCGSGSAEINGMPKLM